VYGSDQRTSNPLLGRANFRIRRARYVESQRLIKDTIKEHNANGTTVFLTTHNMEEANQLCDITAIINHGKIAAIDSPEKLRLRSSGLQSIEISFDKPVNTEELVSIKGVEKAAKMGDKLKLYVNETGAVIDSLVDYARSKELNIITINTLGQAWKTCSLNS